MVGPVLETGVGVGVAYQAAHNTGGVSISINRGTPFCDTMVVNGGVNDGGVQILEFRTREGIRCGYQQKKGNEGSD